MASFFASPSFLSHSITRAPTTNKYYFSSSSSQTRPPNHANQPSHPQTATPSQQLSINSADPPLPPEAAAKVSERRSAAKTNVESTDWIASSLTRRFGIGAGLAWFGFLAAGVVSEQIKTRFEVSQQEANTRDIEKEEEVILPNGIRYYELRVGGGASPRPGDLVVVNVKGRVQENGQEFVNTFEGEKKKPLALVMGSRPYSKGICEGIEYVLKSMKAGGKRRVIIPSNLGFGEEGADLGEGVQIPPFATLEYVIEVDRVSIAPA